MAKYTTQIRSIVESGHDIFDFDYPIFDENYRGVLEKKILDHYYFREIGLETVGQFKHFLKSRLNVIMPYYNQLYNSENLITKDDYFINLNTTETHTKTVGVDTTGRVDTTLNDTTTDDGGSTSVNTQTNNLTNKNTLTNNLSNKNTQTNNLTNTTTVDETTTGKDVFSDTPQAKLSGLDYATNLTERTNDVNGTNTQTTTGTVVDDSTSTGTAITDNLSTGTVTDDTTNTVDNTRVQVATTGATNTGSIDTIEEYTTTMLGGGGMRYNADILMEWRKSFLNIDEQIIDRLKDLFINIY